MIVSAISLWNHKARPKMYHWGHWALDSGGFVAMRKAGEYPFGPDDYLQAINVWKPAWAASLDYPCEPELAPALGTVNERITRTVELAHYLCQRDHRIVPVLQGYAPEHYEECWRRLPQTGRVAIGSLCRRQSLTEIRELIRHLREFVRVPWRHGFGIKLRALRYADVSSFFTSVDSNAWEFAVMAERHSLRHLCFRDRMRWAFDRYRPKVEALRAAPRQGVLL